MCHQNKSAYSSLDLTPSVVCGMFDSLMNGLDDYSTDERGDVGSWIRIACVKGLSEFIYTLLPRAALIPNFADYLPVTKFHDALGGILKQGVERLDNVRQQAGEQIMKLLTLNPDSDRTEWRIDGASLMEELFSR